MPERGSHRAGADQSLVLSSRLRPIALDRSLQGSPPCYLANRQTQPVAWAECRVETSGKDGEAGKAPVGPKRLLKRGAGRLWDVLGAASATATGGPLRLTLGCSEGRGAATAAEAAAPPDARCVAAGAPNSSAAAAPSAIDGLRSGDDTLDLLPFSRVRSAGGEAPSAADRALSCGAWGAALAGLPRAAPECGRCQDGLRLHRGDDPSRH